MNVANRLLKIAEELGKEKTYGGQEFSLPDNHLAGMRVPKGGACCANCKHLSEDEKHCDASYWQKWSGTDELPYPADEYCSDFWEPRRK